MADTFKPYAIIEKLANTYSPQVVKNASQPFAVNPANKYIETQGEFVRDKGNLPIIKAYPNKKYIDKNLAPEEIPIEALKALAKSQAFAEKKGLLPKEVTDTYLASALAEGRWADFGVNSTEINYNSKAPKEFEQKAKELASQGKLRYSHDNKYVTSDELYDEKLWENKNASFDRIKEFANILGNPEYDTNISIQNGQYAKSASFRPDLNNGIFSDTDTLYKNANLKTLALINKAEEYKKTFGKEIQNPMDYWAAFNGWGIAKGNVSNPEKYTNKILESHNILQHPVNTILLNTYNDLVNKYRKEVK